MSFAEIMVKGRNKQMLFDKLAKRNIAVYSVKNVDEKCFIVTVDAKDTQKVFTICGNMWYNKLIKFSGFKGACSWFKRHIVLCFGIVALFIVAYFFDNVLLDVEFRGVKLVSKTELGQHLEDCGIKKYSLFSSIDLEAVEKEVSSFSNDFSFVTVKKSGNKLIIDVTERQNSCSLKDYSRNKIVSTVSGKLVSANVYRGKLVKNIGDYVACGETLIEGVFTFNEENFDTYAFGKVKIEVAFAYEYFSELNDENEKARAIAVAKFMCEDKTAEVFDVAINDFAEGFCYRVELKYYVECGG